MDDNSPWKRALSARRKQFEILSANEAPLKCTVFRASGDGRNLLADPRFDDLKNHIHEGSVGQSCLKDSDTIIHALFFGYKTTWERFSSAADESGRIASKIPSEVLAGLSGYFYNSTLLWPIAEWSSLIAEISVNIAWSKSRRKVLHPKLPMSVDWTPSMPDFWFIELENVFTASCDSIDVLTNEDNQKKKPKKRKLTVSVEKQSAILDGKEYDLKSAQVARWIKVLVDHEGEWISSPRLKDYDFELDEARTDRLKKNIPDEIRSLIESTPQRGSRLKLA